MKEATAVRADADFEDRLSSLYHWCLEVQLIEMPKFERFESSEHCDTEHWDTVGVRCLAVEVVYRR